jgi:hypothetical protein
VIAELLGRLGAYDLGRAEFSKAETLFQRALAIREKALGPDHPDTVKARATFMKATRSQVS